MINVKTVMDKLKYAQDLIKTSNVYVANGFNQFVMGHERPNFGDGYSPQEANARIQGYEYAEKMAKNGEIVFTHSFKCGKYSDCHPFQYGGFFVCNSCRRKSVDKYWWIIKVEKDGNAYCCHGIDFINLQESENYAFGNTFQEAIENYGFLMVHRSNFNCD